MSTHFYNVANNAITTITNNPLSSGGTSITLATGTGTKFPSTYFLATIWDNTAYPSNPSGDPNMEVVLIDSRSTDTLTVNASGRGFASTTAVQHASGSTIAVLDTKQFEDQITTALATGWIPVADTWTYSSIDNPTGVITIPTNGTTTYSVGMRIKFTNNGATHYGIITAVSATTLTYLGEISPTSASAGGGTAMLNTFTNSAITNVYYSHWKNPYGFPADPRSWTIETIDTSQRSQSLPVDGTWYNIGSVKITVPIGAWRVGYQATFRASKTTSTAVNGYTTLSTGAATESDTRLSAYFEIDGASGNLALYTATAKNRNLVLAAKTDYFLNMKSSTTSSAIVFENSIEPAVITATSNYL